MRWFKDQIPRSWRLAAQLLRRQVRDQQAGLPELFAQKTNTPPAYAFYREEQQLIRPGEHLENKLHNLRLGSEAVSSVIIQPGQVFSFWHSLGAPTAARGYQVSRNLVNGKLIAEPGGGLCQLSGILYLLALRVGLEIMERHHHSKDIYTEAERFCPLGSDATVVYGYKDLRLRNLFSFPVVFKLDVQTRLLVAQITAPSPLPNYSLAFKREKQEDNILVKTIKKVNGGEQIVAHSTYQRFKT